MAGEGLIPQIPSGARLLLCSVLFPSSLPGEGVPAHGRVLEPPALEGPLQPKHKPQRLPRLLEPPLRPAELLWPPPWPQGPPRGPCSQVPKASLEQ